VSAFLQDASRLLDQGVGWAGLPGDALAFVLSGLVRSGKRLLVVVDGPDTGLRLERALRFFDTPGLLPFPADDGRPYDGFASDPVIPQQRIVCLNTLAYDAPCIVVAPVQALMQRVPDEATRARGTRDITTGDTIERDDLVDWLSDAGYLALLRVDGPGRFAVRGDIVDVWPVGMDTPVRIDFFDDEVESLRRFDPSTQRTQRSIKQATVLPAREERIDGAALDRLHRELTPYMREQDRGVTLRRRMLRELEDGIRSSAIEDYLPALVPTVEPLASLFGSLTAICVSPEDVGAAARDHTEQAQRRWEALEGDEQPLVPPAARYIGSSEILSILATAHPVYGIAAEGASQHLGATSADEIAAKALDLKPVVKRLHALAEDYRRVAIVVGNEGRAQTLIELLEPHGLVAERAGDPWDIARGDISVLVGDLPRGFIARDSGWAFIPATALLGRPKHQRHHRAHAFFDVAVQSVHQLKEGDLVVHRLHGIGRYLGIRREVFEGVDRDFVHLEYRNGDLLAIAVTALDQISRYQPARANSDLKLDVLGGQTWARRAGKVRDSLLHAAEELLTLYAKREVATRIPLPPPTQMYRQFAEAFPYDETPDQVTAIAAVLEDLVGDQPMDHLICGDVGFGKTEIALRATMRMVEHGRQVAVLCPTTVLAYQHVRTFRKRFEGTPVTVGMLTRLTDGTEHKRVVEGLKTGSVDIAIGTTKLLSRSIRYANLGMVVVDEEHRFGVKQKDRLKKMRAEVDILSMSATPIPRTLQMALSGIRDMTLIATPPRHRLAVRTTMARLSRTRVRDAILHELRRDGQVFFIHNRVESIQRVKKTLAEWIPEATFAVAHGQMSNDQLENVLVDFIDQRANVLVCTAIVETGIDLPRVNTILINRADLFGLAQLYQLRGRVGRSDRRASCLLLVPEDGMTREAKRRLRVLVENTALGSGFAVAAADLELRGGGNLLGESQSGNIDAVGYETWVDLLEDAIRRARGDLDRQTIDPEVEAPFPTFIADGLVRDPSERLRWYRRLSSARTYEAVDEVMEDLQNMFGDLPVETRHLGELAKCKLYCRDLGIVRATWMKVRVELVFHEHKLVTDSHLDFLIAEHKKRLTLKRRDGEPTTLSARFTPHEAKHPFRYLLWLFVQLGKG
jgi:transcription-repair coupling factor (superfamily II helicase)